ncbi:cation efflux family-domain-containing protein [Elsinoe ampelina]|uniref:Cation efflux family-domain-containing protein n=1 Tax=Elsinoe ampelina TaxID=302913 RepID=A0A6A6GAB5_9PEZI|nr:cation efflux family-domain-containing protein [Elsinoe ampelina]
MSRDPDLHRAISLRPSPFHPHPDRAQEPERSSNFLPGGYLPVLPVTEATSHKPAASTAVEPTTPTEHAHDPVARPTYARSTGSSGDSDVESARLPSYVDNDDPFQLASKLKTAEQIESIRANQARKRSKSCTTLAKGKDAYKAKKLQQFYESQNENIERLLKPVDDHRREAKEEAGAEHLQFKIAVTGSFIANCILAALQLYGAIASGSLSLFTTMIDSIFDPMSNLMLILCHRAVNKVDSRRFPSGKARIENAGNIFFSFLMSAVSLVLVVMSIRDLVEGSDSPTLDFHLPSVIAVSIAFGTKFCLFLYCWALRNKYSQVRILWEDHRNDLFINGFGVLTSVGGSKLRWWLDPMGALILSCLIICLWLHTAYSEFQLLIGVSADTNMLQLLTYISMTHDPRIIGLDTVRAWHSGPRLIVEVDIVMDERQSLKETHDVAEALQIKLESLPNVERSYVHVDYETSHAPEHFTKKTL